MSNNAHLMTTRQSFLKTTAMGALLILATTLTSCAAPNAKQSPAATGNLTVYAAASLQDVFKEIGTTFETQHPGTTVRFSFAGSQQLAEQIGLGAPADVFASANKRLMDVVVKAGRVNEQDARVFAQNRLVVVFPKGNPAGIERLQDLSKSGLKLVLAAPAVPVGAYSLEFLKKASAQPEFGTTYSPTVLANVVSYEADVRAVFSKVALGEADAGIVYSSDVLADKAKDVGTIDIPNDLNTVASYPIAPLKDSPNLPLATAFVDYVLSPEGQTVLRKHGFLSERG